jgi:integrase
VEFGDRRVSLQCRVVGVCAGLLSGCRQAIQALCLFTGSRPSIHGGEITRLKPEDIDLETGLISISAEVSKVREPRKVVIHPNLAAWLRAYSGQHQIVTGGSYSKKFAALGLRRGLDNKCP